jgi:antitoxin component YwqK of YwqJK toxin-antitoxin module
MKMNYKNNKRHGKYIIYQPCEYGSVLLKGKFKNDKLYGKQEHFFPDGKQRGVQVFEDGNLVSSSGDVSFVLLNQYKEQTMDSKLY